MRLFFLFWATLIAKTFATVFLLKEGVTTFRELTAVCFEFKQRMKRWKKKHLEVFYFYDKRKETFISKFIAVRLMNIQEVKTSTQEK